MRVFRQLAESPGGGFAFGAPKSEAGRRTIVFPDLIVPDLAWHLARFAGPEDDSLLFTSPSGSPLRNSNFRRRVWLPALAVAGLADIHFHDLRHAGNVLAAAAGANLRELMERMSHSTSRAAMVYLHSTDEQKRKIADALGGQAAHWPVSPHYPSRLERCARGRRACGSCCGRSVRYLSGIAVMRIAMDP